MNEALALVTAIGAVVTAVATIGLVVVAYRTLGGARGQLTLLRQQVEQERRPYVVADLVPGLHGAGTVDLVISNAGRSLARQVVIEVGQLAKRNADDHISDALSRYLTTPKSLVSGTRHRVMWHDAGNAKAGRLDAGVVGAVSARITYTDDGGTEYTESYELDHATMTAVSPVPTNGPRRPGDGNELADIDCALRALAGHVGELRR